MRIRLGWFLKRHSVLLHTHWFSSNILNLTQAQHIPVGYSLLILTWNEVFQLRHERYAGFIPVLGAFSGCATVRVLMADSNTRPVDWAASRDA